MFTCIPAAASVVATVALTLMSLSPATAATLAQSAGAFTLRFPNIPEGVFVFDATDDSGIASYVSSFSMTFDLSTRARADLAAREDVDVLDSYAPVGTVGSSPFVFARNFDGPNPDPDAVMRGPVVLGGFIDYNLSAAAAVDDPSVDRAQASLSLDLFAREPSTDVTTPLLMASARADTATSGDLDDQDQVEGSLAFDLTLDPNGAGLLSTIELGHFFESSAVAEDLSPIPVPATLPLLLAALSGLVLVRRQS